MNTSRTRLFIPISILLIIFSILTINIINVKYEKNKELHVLENNIAMFIKISKLVHEIQMERGLSSGYTASKGKAFAKELKVQRKQTTKKIVSYKIIFNSNLMQLLKNPKKVLIQIEKIRNDIDILNISNSSVIEYYSKLNKELLQYIYYISENTTSSVIRKKIVSYFNFLNLKEHVGIQRALGTEILLKNKINFKLKQQYYEEIVKYHMYRNEFMRTANKEMEHYYISHMDNKIIWEIEAIDNAILYAVKNATLEINPDVWFDLMSKRINILKDIENHLTDDILNNIENELIDYNYNLRIFIVLILYTIAIFIYMIMKIMRVLKNETKLRDMIDKHIIVSSTDLNGKITYVSSAFCKISGYTKEELLGKPHSIIRHPDMKSEVFSELWKRIKTGHTFNGNIKNITKDGGFYWVDAKIEPVINARGKIESYIAIRHDISDRKFIEELNYSLKEKIEQEVDKNRKRDQQMLEQSRLAQMGEMISMIAHQWRQPLSAIGSISASLELKAKLNKLDNDLVIAQAEKISKYAQHLSLTINDFRDFFKPVKLKEEVLLKDVVRSALNIVGSSIEYKNISIIEQLNSIESFKTYANELKQVVLNLLKNAEDMLIEKNIQDPMITIITKDNQLIIKDNAGGIPEDIIDKIFDPYFSTKLEKNGTGLGLYMSKMIIEEHCEGKLSVANDGDGAVFSIELKQDEQVC